MEKRTKIIVILVVLVFIGAIIGIALGLYFSGSSSIELEVLPRSEDNSKQPLIRFQTNDVASWTAWQTRLEELFNEYRWYGGTTDGTNRMTCSYDDINVWRGQKVCEVPLHFFEMCTQSSKLCVFFRLNKILNWTPVPFNTTAGGLPANMPEDLQNHIEIMKDRVEANIVWLTCEGEAPADKEYIGPLQYVPWRGFPTYFFPNSNQKGYLSPLVAVMFERPQTGIVINIVCSAWAKNIRNDEEEQQGVAHFSMMLD